MAANSTMYDVHFYGSQQDLKAIDDAFAKKEQEVKDSGEFDYDFWEFLEVYDPRRHGIREYEQGLAEAWEMKCFFKELKASYPNVEISGEVRIAFIGGDYSETNIKISSERGSPELKWEETYKDEEDWGEED